MTAIDEAITQLDALISRLKAGSTASAAAKPETDAPAPAAAAQSNGASKAAESTGASKTTEPAPAAAAAAEDAATQEAQRLAQKKKKDDKAAAKAAKAAASSGPVPAEGGALFNMANIRVGKIVKLDDIESEKLHKCQIDVGNGETKQIVAGLRKYYTSEQMLYRLVVVIINLKAAKLAGQLSEGMILAADAPKAGEPDDTLVQTLQPPEGSNPGDQVYLEGGAPSSEFPKTLKRDLWKKLAPSLTVQGGAATFDGKALVTSKGLVTLPDEMPDGASIH
ncbi:hypothetical protein WJX72_001059 [[Myrmecia] bisecta]|uniref:tRNA-binding domain-containing protein n=1 Tax=[Myrmecia] bisecta TaxID=41462 RepID=A0AAW1Q6H1_9CHLO